MDKSTRRSLPSQHATSPETERALAKLLGMLILPHVILFLIKTGISEQENLPISTFTQGQNVRSLLLPRKPPPVEEVEKLGLKPGTLVTIGKKI